jgi:hypothetical protein
MKGNLKYLIELYRRGIYDELPIFEKQIEALNTLYDPDIREVLYGGSSGGGKSVLGAIWKIMNRASMPGSVGLVAREEFERLRDTTMQTYFGELNRLGFEQGTDYWYNGNRRVIEFWNGSIEYFREIRYLPRDPYFDRLGSYNLTDVLLDEAQQIHWRAINVLKGRFRLLSGDGWQTYPKSLYTCNPAKNWIYTEFFEPHRKQTLGKTKAFIPALPTHNPHLPRSFLDNLLSADEVTRQRLYYGNFEYDDDPAVLCEFDMINDIFTNDHVKPGKKRISSDLAMQGRDRFVAGSWHGLRVTIDIDKPKATGREIEQSLKQLKTQRGVNNSSMVADSDGLGAYIESYIQNIKTFHGADTKLKSDHKRKYKNLRSACGFKLAEHINRGELYVHDVTREQREAIIKELNVCLKRHHVDSDGKLELLPKDKMKDALGRSPDYLDMLMMGMYWEIKETERIVTV